MNAGDIVSIVFIGACMLIGYVCIKVNMEKIEH